MVEDELGEGVVDDGPPGLGQLDGLGGIGVDDRPQLDRDSRSLRRGNDRDAEEPVDARRKGLHYIVLGADVAGETVGGRIGVEHLDGPAGSRWLDNRGAAAGGAPSPNHGVSRHRRAASGVVLEVVVRTSGIAGRPHAADDLTALDMAAVGRRERIEVHVPELGTVGQAHRGPVAAAGRIPPPDQGAGGGRHDRPAGRRLDVDPVMDVALSASSPPVAERDRSGDWAGEVVGVAHGRRPGEPVGESDCAHADGRAAQRGDDPPNCSRVHSGVLSCSDRRPRRFDAVSVLSRRTKRSDSAHRWTPTPGAYRLGGPLGTLISAT